MSFCDMGINSENDGWYEAITQTIARMEPAECNLCGSEIPAGDYFLQRIWVCDGDSWVFNRCDWCADTFADAEIMDYQEPGLFEDAMCDRLSDMSAEDLLAEHKEWFSKPQAFREEFNSRWPNVEDILVSLMAEIAQKKVAP